MYHLTAEQAAEARDIRARHDDAHARLRAANSHGPTDADLAEYTDVQREITAREKAMRARWWPDAVEVYVSKITSDLEVHIWPSRDADAGQVWTEAPELPDQILVIDDSGQPKSMVDVDRLHADSVRLMYQMAVTAGDDDATDKVSTEWVGRLDPDYFGYVAAGALSLLVRNILGPVLEVTDRLGVDLRQGLRAAAENAEGLAE